jgi:predicted amidophosphoribosyltransferase
VLVDDVVTTGATLADCASVLRSCGAVVTQAAVIAVA